MDPPHITEFASQRFFEKVRQLSEPKDQPQDGTAQSHDGYAVGQSSTFILPIGQPRLPDQQIPHDHQKAEKRRANFSLRAILPTRTSVEHDIRSGLRQVERFWEVKGYNARRANVDIWYQSVTNQPIEHVPKPRRTFMSLSRKKSSLAVGEGGKAAADSTTYNRERRGSDSGRRGSDVSTNSWRDFVFGTSLSAGMPMGPLIREQLQVLLPDLPTLHSIWLPTAEALILDRGIVGRPQDIKRNGPALLDLIREDGAAEEDEWLYGRTAPESVRPPLEAIEEDPIE
ncbi:hypothetical protein GQX73_g6354 [Xylaria multiplex]|uniref:Uncharacterized protein n=1 Tax=Xylaria multiplex TaxID=323545 RepID=A0A7C8IM61_9PEZI|nr:hypothetical protein GQX73_g6354 [Xylaria multiplex]